MRAVVTGAAHGIGAAVAHRLAREARWNGGGLLLVDRDAESLGAVTKEVCEAGTQAIAAPVDLGEPDAGEQVAAAVREHLGGLDALVSNAATVRLGPLAELSLEDWDAAMAVNVRATWLLAKALRHQLAESRGCIVATASLAGHGPGGGFMGAYSPSKAALMMLIRQLAQEWGPQGIRCVSVSPGLTWTSTSAYAYSDPQVEAWRRSRVPADRIGRPEDVAAVVAFLAGPEAAYINGVDLIVDGALNTTLLPTALRPPETKPR